MIRNRKKSNKKMSQMVIMTFFVILLVLSYKVLAQRNRVMRLELNNTSYVELLKYDRSMTTVNDRAKLRDILIMLNELGAKEVDVAGSPVSEEFINIYDKNYNKTTVIKSGRHIKFENKWYLLDERSSANFDKVFEKYN